MLEYVFFEPSIADEFSRFVNQYQVENRVVSDEDMITVEMTEDIEDTIADKIDYEYERLLQKNGEIIEQGDDALENNVAGVQVALADGSGCTIRIAPEFLSRMLTAISMEELRDFAQIIAEGVERRDNSPLCHVIEE